MDAFAALADPTRRKILEMLADQGPLSATSISNRFDISPPAISQHLKALREAELVQMEKRKQQRIYRINSAALLDLEAWANHMAHAWDARFDALDQVLQAEKRKLAKRRNKKGMQHAKGKSR